MKMKIEEEKLQKLKEQSAKFWLTITRTRPAWGMIPVRIVFGVMLVLEGISRFTFVRHNRDSLIAQLPHEWQILFIVVFSVVEIIGGAMAVPGVMTRFVGMAILVEMFFAIMFERIPFAFTHDLQAQILLVGIASLLMFSGPGRYSVDGLIARKILKKYPIEKWKVYVYAETPLTKWYE
ncbi:MAG: DoxX family protein [Patescibacteria group bacterium]|jgi:uncharacterized membrane protein YphA (DoxX/SURF4 family)